MNLLLLSNSRMPGGEPFAWAKSELRGLWEDRPLRVALVPFAGVTMSWDAYEDYVRGAFNDFPLQVDAVHKAEDPVQLLRDADMIFVGGGNTFHLTKHLYAWGLMESIHELVYAGKPYMGWSAGANVAGPTLCTTNDMPIIQPPSFDTLGLVPFQINPHYTNAGLPNHGGETRDDRLREYVTANPGRRVVCLPEGSYLHVTNGQARYFGERPGKVIHSDEPEILLQSDDLIPA